MTYPVQIVATKTKNALKNIWELNEHLAIIKNVILLTNKESLRRANLNFNCLNYFFTINSNQTHVFQWLTSPIFLRIVPLDWFSLSPIALDGLSLSLKSRTYNVQYYYSMSIIRTVLFLIGQMFFVFYYPSWLPLKILSRFSYHLFTGV